MKFRKPSAEKLMGHSEVVDFYDSLPSEFEILGPGEVAVKWPEGFTRENLLRLADTSLHGMNPIGMAVALRSIAAIAPERKKRRMSAWQYGCAIPQLFSVDWRPESAETKWRKVGECEIDD